MKWLALLALMLVAGLANAGTLHACIINDTSQLTGLINDSINFNESEQQYYLRDVYTGSTINTSAWNATLQDPGKSFFLQNNTRLGYYETGINGGYNGWFNFLLDFKAAKTDVNVTFYWGFSLPDSAQLAYFGFVNTTSPKDAFYRTNFSVIITGASSNATALGWVFFNYTNQSIYAILPTLEAFNAGTFNVSLWNHVYIQTHLQRSGSTSPTGSLVLDYYINGTNPNYVNKIPFYAKDICYQNSLYQKAFLFLSNGTVGAQANISNWTLVTPSVNGSVEYSFNAKNYSQNFTLATPLTTGDFTLVYNTVNLTQFLGQRANFTIFVMDENNVSFKPKYQLIISNSTNTTNYGTINPGTANEPFFSFANGIPNGVIGLQLINSSYYPRTINVTFNDYPNSLSPSNYNMSAYLVKIGTDSQLVNFYIKQFNGASAQGAIVSVYRNFGSGWQLVDSIVTSSDGSAGFGLYIFATYRVIATWNGLTAQVDVNPTTNAYTIYMSSPPANYSNFFTNTSYTITPNVPYLTNASGDLVTVTFSVQDSASQLNGIGFNLTYWNNTEFCAPINSSLSDASVSCTLNKSLLTDNVTAVFYIRKLGFIDTYAIVTVYYFNEQYTIGWLYAGQLLSTYGIPWTGTLLSILFAVLGTIAVSRYLGFGSSIITMAIFTVCAYAGLINNWTIIIIGWIITIAILITGRVGL